MTDTERRTGDQQRLAIAESQARIEAAKAGDRPLPGTGSGKAAPEATVPTELSAERIEVTQGGIARADAGRIAVRQGGVGRAQADEISVRQGGIGLARGDRISVEMGGIGAALGTDVQLRRGFSRLAAARNALTMEQAGAMTVVANRVEMRRQSGTVFLFARHVEGDVRAVFDWRAGAAFGAAAGALVAAATLLRGRRR